MKIVFQYQKKCDLNFEQFIIRNFYIFDKKGKFLIEYKNFREIELGLAKTAPHNDCLSISAFFTNILKEI